MCVGYRNGIRVVRMCASKFRGVYVLLSVEWPGIGNFSCGTTTMAAVLSLGKSYLILWLLFSFSGHTVQQCLCLSPCLYSKLCLGKIREVKFGVL